MALSSAKHEPFYETSGGGADQVRSEELTNITAAWASEKAEGCKKYIADPVLGPIIYQLQQMQDEIDYLRTEVSANKDKTGITTSQANAITANTAKTSFPGLGTTSTTALAGDTTTISTTQARAITDSSVLGQRLKASRQASITKSTAIEFGEFTTTIVGKNITYSLPITVVETTIGKSGNTTITKTGSITLT